MKVLLINSPSKKQRITRDMAGGLGFGTGETAVLPPLDLAYMAATLLKRGHQAKIIDLAVEDYPARELEELFNDFSPDAVIATVSLPSIYQDCVFIGGLRQWTAAPVLVKTGMTFPALLKEILERSRADLCVFGECDLNIDKIISNEEKRGTAVLQNGRLQIAADLAISNLDELPLPARQLLPNAKYHYVLLGDKTTAVQTSRGCPFPCAYYCPYPLVQGKAWRARSAENVVVEIGDIVDNLYINRILFRDATFTLDRTRTAQICALILQKGLRFEWWCESRVDCLDHELMGMMKEAGCRGINIGVETGCPELMQTQAKVGLTIERLKELRDHARQLGLNLHFLLMVGLPQETRESMYQTFRMLVDLKPESIGITVTTPYPGTPLFFEAKEKGWIESEEWERYDGHTAVMHTGFFRSQEITRLRGYLYLGFDLMKRQDIFSRIRFMLLDRYLRTRLR
ncbi:MAG: B12-binding domain-containing radical SAM protein [Candidatus Omnitrophota bacterium]